MTTAVKPIFKENFGEISYDEVNQIVTAKWIGFLKLEDTKRACADLIAFVHKHKIAKHISDQTQLKVLSKEVQGYLVNEVFPALGEGGLRKLAVLVSQDIFAKATVDNVNDTTVKAGKITIKTFNAKADCIQWLNA